MGGLTLGMGETVESASWITQFLAVLSSQTHKEK